MKTGKGSRKILSFIAAALMMALLICSAAAETPAGGDQRTSQEKEETAAAGRSSGGWEPVAAEPRTLPDDAQAAFEKATADLDGIAYTPVALLSTQVVAGMNYCILCQVMPAEPDAEPAWCLVYIYADPEGNAEITTTYEIYIDRHA